MILIYTDYKLINDCKEQNYLFPLLKLLVNGSEELEKEYQLCNEFKTAQVFIFPIAVDYFLKSKKNKLIFQKFLDLAAKEFKKTLVFTSGDIGYTIKDSNVYTLRLGGFASKVGNKGWIMPPFITDPYLLMDNSEGYHEKISQPEIGFVGQSNGSLIKIFKDFLLFLMLNLKRFIGKECVDYQSFYPSSFFRHHYLSKLQKDGQLTTDFIFKKKYRGGVTKDLEKHKSSVAFYNNIKNNLYTFCMRGAGNFSVRLYETLAMGRIPIVLNTDCKFPFENIIEWQKNCIIVQEGEKEKLAQNIIEYHNRYSKEEITAIQKENRILWQEYFTETKFFLHFKNEILKII